MILIIIVGLILIGVLSNYFGKVFEKFKLPSLIGMIIFGMIIGPSFLNFVPKVILNISSYIKDIALVTVLFIGGLGISLNDIKKNWKACNFIERYSCNNRRIYHSNFVYGIFKIFIYSGRNSWIYNSSC